MENKSFWLRPRVFAISLCAWLLFYASMFFVGGGVYHEGKAAPFFSQEVMQHLMRMAVPFGLATPPLLHWGYRIAAAGHRGVDLWRRLALGALLAAALHQVVFCLSLHGFSQPGMLFAAMPTSTLPFLGISAVGLVIAQMQIAAQRDRELVTSQLRALRSQLQPHFLFNTLQAIASTARHDGPLAAKLTTLLGDLLRQSLQERSDAEVTLGDELELLTPYLELQKLRFGDRLTVDLDMPSELLAAQIPDLLLQPMVENALQHGIEQRPGAGRIHLQARRSGNYLELSVHDDGAGPAQSTIEDGIGLGTTRERLRVLFGDRAELKLVPAVGGGTIASIRLPYKELRHAA